VIDLDIVAGEDRRELFHRLLRCCTKLVSVHAAPSSDRVSLQIALIWSPFVELASGHGKNRRLDIIDVGCARHVHALRR
jgi:hypothetical protein